ncbi:hypothetical protein F5Y10DRAFT_232114 [Nemania abortiva]|nr:hypothetical protein F5Y10DRAFT_232114 [Nemania abortiva]
MRCHVSWRVRLLSSLWPHFAHQRLSGCLHTYSSSTTSDDKRQHQQRFQSVGVHQVRCKSPLQGIAQLPILRLRMMRMNTVPKGNNTVAEAKASLRVLARPSMYAYLQVSGIIGSFWNSRINQTLLISRLGGSGKCVLR